MNLGLNSSELLRDRTMLFLDRCLSTWLGRSCMILEEEYVSSLFSHPMSCSQLSFSVDLDLPVLLPDEDQMQAASMELYNSFLPMAIMKSAASRVVYSVVRSPPAYEAMVITELEKSVQKWRASLPERCTHQSSVCCRDNDANNLDITNLLIPSMPQYAGTPTDRILSTSTNPLDSICCIAISES